jgi:hypothetical protein
MLVTVTMKHGGMTMKKTMKETVKETTAGGMIMMKIVRTRRETWCGAVQEAEDADAARLVRRAAAARAAKVAAKAAKWARDTDAARVARSLGFNWVSVRGWSVLLSSNMFGIFHPSYIKGKLNRMIKFAIHIDEERVVKLSAQAGQMLIIRGRNLIWSEVIRNVSMEVFYISRDTSMRA